MDAQPPPGSESNPVLALRSVTKAYPTRTGELRVLYKVDLHVVPGQRLAVVGKSGSGNSTLLHLCAGVDVPTHGSVEVAGQKLEHASERERTFLRRDTVGLVFQFFHLLPHLSVGQNVALPSVIAADPPESARSRARELLERVGLGDRFDDPAEKLSGGEMQRVAICRALQRRPRLLLADEPTGNLDEETGAAVMDMMLGLVRELGTALVYVTHSDELAQQADRVVHLHQGSLT